MTGAHRGPWSAPEPLTAAHQLDDFDCGKQPLDQWLKTRALANEGRASRTYVVTASADPDRGKVIAYYTLASGAVSLTEVPRRYRQSLPNPVGVMLLGRLAVDRHHNGRGIGAALLRRAFQQTLQVAAIAGIRALVVHAIDEEAAAFYARYGFQRFPPATLTLFIATETIADAL